MRAGGGRVQWKGGRVNSEQVVFVKTEGIPGQGRQECDPRCRRETNRTEKAAAGWLHS